MDGRLPQLIIAVPDIDEYAGMLLGEWDTQIAAYAEALGEAFAARRDLTSAQEAMAIVEAETVLAARGPTDAERRAHTVLALRAHVGWRDYRRQACTALDRIRDAGRRAAVARMRVRLIRAALVAALEREGDDH